MMMKICTDVEQSNKFIELGIDVNTADMCYHFIEINKTPLCVRWEKVHDDEKDNSLPAWSLSALFEIIRSNGRYEFQMYEGGYYFEANGFMTESYFNPVDACVAMIEKLNELKML